MINLKKFIGLGQIKSGEVVSDKSAKSTKNQVYQIAKDWALNQNLVFNEPIDIKYRYFDDGN